MDSIVLLVDDKIRDLAVSALIAHKLESLGVKCHLEPLESYQSCLEAYRPKMILFNLLTAGHLERYSRRLHEMGVLTGVLLNEGLCYDDEVRKFNVGKFHSTAHVDYFFCWNQPMADSLREEGVGEETKIVVAGPPRFDFYFSPWREEAQARKKGAGLKPSILLCTNLGLTGQKDFAESDLDKRYVAWSSRIPAMRNYKEKVESQVRSRDGVLKFLEALIDEGKYDITLRPHPREQPEFYRNWLERLPEEKRLCVRIDKEEKISDLILQCDLHLAIENCTTTMESWIAKKPTIVLVFDRCPGMFFEFNGKANPCCEEPSKLPALVDQELANPDQAKYAPLRESHLSKWCNSPKGEATALIASEIADAVKKSPEPDWSHLGFSDFRRCAKLKLARLLGVAYHYDPLLWLKYAASPGKVAGKRGSYRKSILPRDVKRAKEEVQRVIKGERSD